MLMANDSSSDVFDGFDDMDNYSIDLDSIMQILSEDSDQWDNSSLNGPEALLANNSHQGGVDPNTVTPWSQSELQKDIIEAEDVPPREYGLPESSEWHRSETIVPPESLAGMGSSQMFEFPETSDWSKMSCIEYDTCSSREGGGSVVKAPLYNYDRNMMPSYTPSCSTAFNFASGDSMGNLIDRKSDQAIDFWHGASNLTASEGSGLNFGDQSAIHGASMDNPALEIKFHSSPAEIGFIDVETSSPDPHRPEINVDPVRDMHCGVGKIYSEQSSCERSGTIADNSTCTDSNENVWFDLSLMESKEQNMMYTDGEVEDKFISSQHIGTSSKMKLEAEEAASRMDFGIISRCQSADLKFEASSHCSPTGIDSSCDADGSSSSDSSRKSLPAYESSMPGKKEMVCIEDEPRGERHASNHSSYYEAGEGYCSSVRSSDCVVEDLLCTDQGSNQFALNRDLHISTKRSKVSVKDERNNDFTLSRKMDFQYAKVNGVVKHSNSVSKSSIDEDADLCILEEISHPRSVPAPRMHEESFITKQRPASDSLYHIGMEGTRLKAIDERITLHVALQDLSQPKSEVAPPDGALAVPLLRHQRIALSWMVQKETGSIHCSGGILADDQGLGKTISTIALILTERSPSSKVSSIAVKQKVLKAFNLDDDEDCEVLRLNGMKQATDSGQHMPNESPEKKDNSFLPAKGRPAAGTLVVCPTSVLRQWAEELQSKVSEEFKLSTLVYHGSNRTKEPLELAKYDVVLTTYSIVSMEVPKQPLVDKDDDEKVEAEGIHSMEFSSSKKRKYSSSVDTKSQKNKKGVNGSLLEAIARPLARVGWFRVVLDEAQSIKNHRTQVARACWGLRAKRRWCLSGTPIQNAIDDLYSYFRFLRYDPYASYKSFCSLIKNPISRNPTNGYKKLQAVLKTIMLRRTKGTLLDGEPIINLPPKSVKLKRVDFSLEERDFYSKLEADSRAQFKVYAAAGTVKQNYVNILLMLLRLRQACDHPLLVKGYDSSSVWRSSIETAKKLDGEKQTKLLDCLEACSEVCSICNDPPEDAVVTICGHIFCNQCILEYLTGDENLCPAVQCKVHLNITYVFSRDTLRRSLFDQPENNDPASQSIDSLEPCAQGLSDSSKIKAALEVLESLSKPQDFLSKDSSLKYKNEVTVCSENSTESCLQDNRQSNKENCLNDSTVKLPEKAIVFSQWTRMLDLLEAQLKNSSIQYRRLDGTMSVLARDKAVKDFNTLPEVTVMIMSLKAASLGLNMVAACHVILLDLWWNPTTEDQAIDRAHRIGQTRPVTVLRLTVKDTVEDRILALQQKKRVMVSSAFGEDETGSRQTRLTVDDLKYLFMA